MFTTTAIVGAWIYVDLGSFWTAIIWSVVTLILIQVGYFVLVIRLVDRLEHEDALGTAPKKNLPKYPDGKHAR